MANVIEIDLDETGYESSIREHARLLNTTVHRAVIELLIAAVEAELDRE